jgi:hypothetical protein
MNLISPYASIQPKNGGELSRLLTAAVVNRGFCNLLLTNPATALARGYNGESFRLASEEQDLVLSIQAQSLAEFARQLTGSRGHPGLESRHRPARKGAYRRQS